MSKDISDIISDWEYDPASISARWVKGNDGKRKVQLRLDLGLFQMEVKGRPDGTTPHGYPSLLEYYTALEKSGERIFNLDFDACAELQQEAMQYYYRYLSFYALNHLEGVIRDTQHNLDIIELVSKYTTDEDLGWQFLQFYPYVRMMNARAHAEWLIKKKTHEDAVHVLQEALDDIREFWSENGEYEMVLESQEVELLNTLLKQVKTKNTPEEEENLKKALERAIATENYEKAADLRDKINMLRTTNQTKVPQQKPKPKGG